MYNLWIYFGTWWDILPEDGHVHNSGVIAAIFFALAAIPVVIGVLSVIERRRRIQRILRAGDHLFQ